jgi:hypothetical protein
MDIKHIFGTLAVVLGMVGIFPYIWSVYKGKTHPHIFSWILYMLMSLSAYMIQASNGAGVGAWNQLFSVFTNAVVVVFALKYTMSKIRTFDSVLLSVALITFILWLYTDSTLFVVIQSCLIIAASLPTVRKIIQHDGPEVLNLYYVNIAKHSCALVAFSFYTLNALLVVFASILVNVTIIATAIVVNKKPQLEI